MRRTTAILVCSLLLCLDARGAVAVTTKDLNTVTPQQLAQMLAGTGITVTNVKFTGAKIAGGSFTGGLADGLGIDTGVILSSGDIANAVGPNLNPSVSTTNDTPGDADLDAIVGAGHSTADAAVLEFDFVPTEGTASFRYVFGSDEYLEFVNQFNDVFAFFVDGVNVALIPGTNTPVAINTVNLDANPTYFVNNPIDFETGAPGPFGTQFDGFTRVLTATVAVTPNVSHHIKLAIADTDDTLLDSAVFLEASSFTSGTCTIPPPPTNLLIQPTSNPDGPVTGIDFLDLSWTAPTPAPSFYYFAINGDDAQTTETTSVANQPPRGNNDPILLKVRAACSTTEFSEAAQFEVSPSPPTASFSAPATANVGVPVTFTDASDPSATSWLWIFGDGDIATTQSVSHAYAAGSYTVRLVASNGAGADMDSHAITVTAIAPVRAAVVMQSRAFAASAPERWRLESVTLAGNADRWLRIQSHEPSKEAVVFLRFLDSSGALARERRLSVAPGQDAAFDLAAYRLEGDYTLELVSSERVTASVTEPRARDTREVGREGR